MSIEREPDPKDTASESECTGSSCPANVVNLPVACSPHAIYTNSMSKMVQIRDVPDKVHGVLKARAARVGMSLSDFIKQELERSAEQPTMQEWLERARQSRPISTDKSAVEVIRELRDSR